MDSKTFTQRYGPWAVVTGASDGIGAEFARALARAGLDLVLVARRQDRLSSLAEELARDFQTRTRVVAADLASERGIEQTLAVAASLDIGLFVASAGFGTSGEFLQSTLEGELSMLDVNCRAVVAMTHALGRQLARRGRGGVVLMSSLLAFQGVPRAAGYAATKAFVQTFAEGLRLELMPLGVDVLACAPGPISSGFAGRADMVMSMSQTPAVVARESLAALGRRGTVRPGWLSKALELALVTLPRWGRVRAMQKVMGGMTRHQLPSRG